MARKWEKKYEEYKSAEKKAEFEKLKQRIEDPDQVRQVSREDTEKYEKMKRIYDYLPQVENLKEAIDVLGQRFQLLKDEEASRAELAKIEKFEAEIEEQRQQYMNNDEQNFDKLVELQDKQIKLNDMKLAAEKKTRDPEIAQMSAEDFKREILATKGQIGKCHLAARYLMEGYSREYIDLKVNKEWKDRRFTSKKPLKDIGEEENVKEEENKDGEKATEDLSKTSVIGEDEGMISAVDSIKNNEKAILDIKKQKEIEDAIIKAHPLLFGLSKIPFLGRGAKKRLENYVKQEQERVEKISEVEIDEEKKYKAKKSEAKKSLEVDEFRAKYKVANYDVMDIAEKGLSGLEQLDKDAKRADLEAKREAYRKAAYERERKRFGQEYADKSNRDDGEER